MSKVFDDIKQGLEQAVAYEKGELFDVKTTKMSDEKIINVTGADLAPGYPEHCQGNGKHPNFEICCDECDYYLDCYPEFLSNVSEVLVGGKQ